MPPITILTDCRLYKIFSHAGADNVLAFLSLRNRNTLRMSFADKSKIHATLEDTVRLQEIWKWILIDAIHFLVEFEWDGQVHGVGRTRRKRLELGRTEGPGGFDTKTFPGRAENGTRRSDPRARGFQEAGGPRPGNSKPEAADIASGHGG